ncbi:leucine-rich alpha-2-glycoprotein precursor, putative [Pediculus humanus corporis]|uniref:Leucine-rich alpha-2-glycoprotein, putative n=1 Tax=Pediculus humanus subsp. corporis TaxID=121224 RepID=E0VDL5_PEDHC|nr:leucine-rich alpha-2-glycoprotein precursor, putative [Pediculus humanus corporis]EEB11471.1 leucine-rich alpha-2-glycoprotein precursor, putative [Pediculus humanus corporis]
MMSKIIIIFIFFYSTGFYFDRIAGDPGRDLCKIYKGGLKCSKLYSNLFPYDIFLSFNDDLDGYTNEMKYLEIGNSNITILQSRSFQRTPYLSQLLLSNVSLTEIEQNAFEGLKKLKLVDISRNDLRKLFVDTFKHTKLNRLNLEGNKNLEIPENGPFLNAKFLTSLSLKNCNIQHFSGSTFGQVPELIHLDVSHNLLKSLPEEIFTPLKHLTILDLSHNFFINIDLKIFKGIPSFPTRPTSLLLSNNPWECDCKLSEFYLWAMENPKTKIWTDKPNLSRSKKLVICNKPNNVSWNSVEMRKLMTSC